MVFLFLFNTLFGFSDIRIKHFRRVFGTIGLIVLNLMGG